MNQSANKSVAALVQRLALRAYASRSMRRILSTLPGTILFETLYFGYKDWIETPGTATLRNCIGPDDWVIDVGANIGFFSEKFCHWVDRGRVLAIEPERLNFERLTSRLTKHCSSGKLIARNGAAANHDGIVRLAVEARHPGDHKISTTGGVVVPAWRLDTLLAEIGSPKVGLIKIDVQGAEMMVLAGAEQVIDHWHPAIFIEIDPQALQAMGTSAQQVMDWLDRKTYRFYQLTHLGPRSIAPADILSTERGYADVLALASAISCSAASS